jgi:hypothetical protein
MKRLLTPKGVLIDVKGILNREQIDKNGIQLWQL